MWRVAGFTFLVAYVHVSTWHFLVYIWPCAHNIILGTSWHSWTKLSIALVVYSRCPLARTSPLTHFGVHQHNSNYYSTHPQPLVEHDEMHVLDILYCDCNWWWTTTNEHLSVFICISWLNTHTSLHYELDILYCDCHQWWITMQWVLKRIRMHIMINHTHTWAL